jgi:hypothetical protein
MNRVKTGGRVAGTPNKITHELREVLKQVVEDEVNELPNLLKELNPDERVGVLVKLLYLVVPKPVDENLNYFEPITEIEIK